MPRDFPFPGAKIVFIDNPADVHNLLSEIFGEDFPIGKNPTESKADFPIGKGDLDDVCAECPVKDCNERTAAYEGADDADGTMLRALKDKAFSEATRTAKLKADIAEREAQLARQAMEPRSPYLWPAPSAEEFAKGVEALRKAIGAASPKVPKDHISTPKFKVSFPFMEKPAEPKGEKYKVDLDLGKPFESLKERIDATLADVRKAEKKRKDAELDDLAGRLFKKMSHQFYRDRGLRLSRINELTRHVSELFEENRTLKHDLRDKEKVIGFYRAAGVGARGGKGRCMTDLDQRALGWIVGRDTGLSSETIWAVMMGVPEARERSYADVPHDPSDFGRCYRLLEVIPEWRDRLDEMPAWFPEWAPMVEHWSEMESLWLEEHKSGNAPNLYELMRRLVDEGLSAR